MNLKIVTYNIKKGFNELGNRFVLDQIRESIQQTGAQIVMLQEVVGENKILQKKHNNWPLRPQFEYLADKVWPHHSYGKNAVFEHRNHGNAILTMFPILTEHNLNVSVHRFEQRGLLHCEIKIPETGRRLHLFNTHLDLLAISRRRQIQQICNYINRHLPVEEPLLFCGDFNDWTMSGTPLINKHLQTKEIFSQLKGSTAFTFPSSFPVLSLDRVFYRGITPVSCGTLRGPGWSRLSDHIPLIAEFEIH